MPALAQRGHRLGRGALDDDRRPARRSAASLTALPPWTIALMRSTKRYSENVSACTLIPSASHAPATSASTASAIAAGSAASKNTPVTSGTTVSRKPPQRSAATGLPNAAGLDRGEAEVLPRGRHEPAAVRVEPAQRRVVHLADEPHVGGSAGDEAVALRAVADDDER